MKRLLAVLVLTGASVNAQTITETFGSGTNQFSIEFVAIGNPNNTADPLALPRPLGSVNYLYNLGKYEVSRDMILKANAEGVLDLTLLDMTTLGGNGLDRPATGVSWNEAARFVNWLNTSKGYQAAYKFSTSGNNDNISLWSVETSAQGGVNRFRHKDAYYFLPSTDEWHKGAFGSPSGIWNKFATGSDSSPSPVSGGTMEGTAVYNMQAGPADITNAGGLSSFGTMAQSGNAWEWTESAFDGSNDTSFEPRDRRGGYWHGASYQIDATVWDGDEPTFEGDYSFGFRVAMVPEPSSLSLLLAGGAVLMAGRRRDIRKDIPKIPL